MRIAIAPFLSNVKPVWRDSGLGGPLALSRWLGSFLPSDDDELIIYALLPKARIGEMLEIENVYPVVSGITGIADPYAGGVYRLWELFNGIDAPLAVDCVMTSSYWGAVEAA